MFTIKHSHVQLAPKNYHVNLSPLEFIFKLHLLLDLPTGRFTHIDLSTFTITQLTGQFLG